MPSTSPDTLLQPRIHTETRYLPPSDDSLPALAVHVTCLVNSYMLWVGVTDESQADVRKAVSHGNLCRDWACAMPVTHPTIPASGTSLFGSSSSDVSLSMSQRLARRFKKQIFLSVDLPPSFVTMGQGPKIILKVEKGVVGILKELEHRA